MVGEGHGNSGLRDTRFFSGLLTRCFLAVPTMGVSRADWLPGLKSFDRRPNLYVKRLGSCQKRVFAWPSSNPCYPSTTRPKVREMEGRGLPGFPPISFSVASIEGKTAPPAGTIAEPSDEGLWGLNFVSTCAKVRKSNKYLSLSVLQEPAKKNDPRLVHCSVCSRKESATYMRIVCSVRFGLGIVAQYHPGNPIF